MGGRVRWTGGAALLLAGTPLAAGDGAVPAAAPVPQLPGWMAGCWELRDGERWAEECWTIPRAGMMLGSGRTGTGDTLRSWEAMRIALDPAQGRGMSFMASPGGAPWTIFAWDPADREGLTFRNAATDYPQRVRYWRVGELLRAQISLADGSNAVNWTFTPMGG
jgi:hypothetical protein